MSSALTSYVAFAGARRVARGPLPDVLPVLKRRHDEGTFDGILVFEVETGRQVDFDLRRPLEALLDEGATSAGDAPRGPGRPKLGVVSREVTLLPRHWEWLEQQDAGISGALRRLVEQAMKNEPGLQRAKRMRAALARVLTAVAGDRPGFEEATRALYAGDAKRVDDLVRKWPQDIRAFASEQMREADRAARGDA